MKQTEKADIEEAKKYIDKKVAELDKKLLL